MAGATEKAGPGRRPRLGLAGLAVGLALGLAAAWLWLPDRDGVFLKSGPAVPGDRWSVFSFDGRFVASYTPPGEEPDEWRLCERSTGREVSRVQHDRAVMPEVDAGRLTCFSNDGEQFLVARFGKATLWEVTSGKRVGAAPEPDGPGQFEAPTLMTDVDGRPFWVVGSREKEHRCAELWTGRPLGTVPPPQPWSTTHTFPGFLFFASSGGGELWEVPAARLRLKLPSTASSSDQWALSGDGGTLALVDGTVRLWDTRTGEARGPDVIGGTDPSLSHDGGLLAVRVPTPAVGGPRGWWEWLCTRLGVSTEGDGYGAVVSDVETGRAVAHFPGVDNAVFVPRGRTLAVSRRGVITFHEPQLSRPWGAILAVVAGSALAGFLLGRAAGRKRRRAEQP